MDIVTVVGARPQFIKAAVVSHALLAAGVQERIVHTGQHYDPGMSDIFFSQLGIPAPDTNLEVGSGTHATQTGTMMIRLEKYLLEQRPDWILVYGDTNSTLASALVGTKLNIPVAHVEAGLRSFNMRMPEEVDRIVTDRISDLLFCPTSTAVRHLENEGISQGVHLTGDVMLDATRFFAERAQCFEMVYPESPFYLATIHRAENTDDPDRLQSILKAFSLMDQTIILPLHPRTKSIIEAFHVPNNVTIVAPVSYLEMLSLITAADKVLTDSGGLQKEAIWLSTPCITLRDETEWVETTNGKWNQIVGAHTESILKAVQTDPEGACPVFGEIPGTTASNEITRLLTT